MKHTSFIMGLVAAQMTKAYFGALTASMADANIDKYFSALIIIGLNKEDTNQRYLSETLMLDKSSIVRIIDYLQEAGLVARQKNELDRRESIVSLTEKGAELMPKLLAAHKEIEDAAFGFMTKNEKEKFVEQISTVHSKLMDLHHVDMKMSLEKK